MIGSTSASTAERGIVAGAAGGIAEIIWIIIYASVTGTDAATLARGVTTAAGANSFFQGSSVASGVVIHLGIALILGVALAFAWRALARRWPKLTSPYAVVPAALAAVWAINFLIVLPLLSPAFVQIVPYPVSLMSKLLFGLAASAVLSYRMRGSTVGESAVDRAG